MKSKRRNSKRHSISNWEKPIILHGRPTRYLWSVWHPQNLQLGKNSDIGAYCYLNAKHGIKIGEGVQIGSHCSIYSISTIDDKRGKVILRKNARIGSHSVVMPGVTIGKNAVVGAMSFVNKDIPAGALAYGCPVRIIKRTRS